MSDFWKKYLIDLGIGLLLALGLCAALGLFAAETAPDVLRILSDGFFVPGAIFLCLGGLTFTRNGGVMDGLGFTFKTALARIRSDYETAHMTFAEYRAERESKATSPMPSVLAGLTHLAIALILFWIYSGIQG